MYFSILVYILTSFGARCAPKSLTFSESFTLATIVTIYAGYSFKSIMVPVLASVGSPLLNAAIFAPWLSIGVFLCLMYVLSCVFRPALAFILAFLPTLGMLLAFYLQDGVMDRVLKILLHTENVYLINYMALTLVFGLFILYDMSQAIED